MNRIRNSIKAIIIRDGNLLAIYKTDPLGDYYILPGGGQHYGECINETLKREVREETTLEVMVQRLRYIRDYISRNHEFAETEKDAHQVELMFECEIVSSGQARVGETPDENQIDVRWLPLDHLMDFRLYPLSLRPLLMDSDETTQPVYLGDIN